MQCSAHCSAPSAALRNDATRPVPVADLAKGKWVPGLANVGVAHLQSPEGWTMCAALAAAQPSAIRAWHDKRPKKAPTVDFVTQLAAALKAALAAPRAAPERGGDDQRGDDDAEEDADNGEDEDEDEDDDNVDFASGLPGDDQIDEEEEYESESDDDGDDDDEGDDE